MSKVIELIGLVLSDTPSFQKYQDNVTYRLEYRGDTIGCFSINNGSLNAYLTPEAEVSVDLDKNLWIVPVTTDHATLITSDDKSVVGAAAVKQSRKS